MTTVTVQDQIEEIFADARAMHTQAVLLQLEQWRHPRRGGKSLVRHQTRHRRPHSGAYRRRTGDYHQNFRRS